MFVPFGLKARLQQSGPGLVNVNAVTRTEAVAQHKDGGTIRDVCGSVCGNSAQDQQQGQ
jgi:Tfp pilus assembly protein FimT